jgi:hypothetical protein
MSKKKAAARAVAKMPALTDTDAQKVAVTGSVSQAMPQSPSWAAATDVQTAVKLWSTSATKLDTNTKAIAGLRVQLLAAEAAQEGLRRDWLAAKQQVTSTVTVFCAGNPELVKSFALDVVTHGRLGPLDAPSGLAVNPGTAPGEVVAKWDKGVAAHGFVVQHATDPTNPATISASTPSTKVTFTLAGLPSSTNVSMRVAAIDPASATGQSPWSAWVVGNAR